MTSSQKAPMTSRRRKAGEVAWKFTRGQWKVIGNPLFEEDEPVQTGSEDQTFPGDFNYVYTLSYNDLGWSFDIFRSFSYDEYPYLVKIIAAEKEELIFIPDIVSLIQLWDRLSVILDIKRESH